MNGKQRILIEKESLEKAITKLKGLKLIIEDRENELLITEILEIIDDGLKVNEDSVENMILDKMSATKTLNPELHFKLYMVHRKLEENKITEEEALKAYEIYLSIEK